MSELEKSKGLENVQVKNQESLESSPTEGTATDRESSEERTTRRVQQSVDEANARVKATPNFQVNHQMDEGAKIGHGEMAPAQTKQPRTSEGPPEFPTLEQSLARLQRNVGAVNARFKANPDWEVSH